MPEPIEFQIVQNLQTALRAIAVASGYHYDVVATAVKLDPNQGVEALIPPDGPRPFVLIDVGKDRWEYFPAGELRLVLPVTIYWVSESLPTDDNSFMQTYFRGCADIERAIAIDPGRGALASDTRITGRTLDSLGGAQVWAVIDVAISLRRTYGQPDT